MPPGPIRPLFFATPAELRRWLQKHHSSASELWVGLYKKGSGRPSVTWPEVVEQALCFGWIDGVRKSLGPDAYVNRLTPRQPSSNWSLINIAKVKELEAKGLMRPAGRAAFAKRSSQRSGVYSFEQRHQIELAPAQARKLKANAAAWAFFGQQPPGYQRLMRFWVMSAKREETRDRRLGLLITESAAGRRVPLLGASSQKPPGAPAGARARAATSPRAARPARR